MQEVPILNSLFINDEGCSAFAQVKSVTGQLSDEIAISFFDLSIDIHKFRFLKQSVWEFPTPVQHHTSLYLCKTCYRWIHENFTFCIKSHLQQVILINKNLVVVTELFNIDVNPKCSFLREKLLVVAILVVSGPCVVACFFPFPSKRVL